jgi:hypothetical protein
MPRFRREAIFEATVDYSGNRSLDAREDRHIEDLVVRTLLEELPRELDQVFGLSVEVRVRGKRYHSLSVFFGVAVAAYGLLSGYKGIYDSIELIRQQASDLLGSALRQAGDFNVNVYSRLPNRDWMEPDMFLKRRFRWRHLAFAEEGTPGRDGFFYFLLGFSIRDWSSSCCSSTRR